MASQSFVVPCDYFSQTIISELGLGLIFFFVGFCCFGVFFPLETPWAVHKILLIALLHNNHRVQFCGK